MDQWRPNKGRNITLMSVVYGSSSWGSGSIKVMSYKSLKIMRLRPAAILVTENKDLHFHVLKPISSVRVCEPKSCGRSPDDTPVFLAMFSSSSGYLVSLCISMGMMSLSCSLRHCGLLSASCGNTRHRSAFSVPPAPLTREAAGLHGTSMKELKRGSFFCLFLIWSRAQDWWLQNLAVSFWNHSPSVPSNCNTSARLLCEQDVCSMAAACL